MLKLILGRAGTGKTARIMSEIAQNVRRGSGGYILIVPEQYSHEAERELCAVCGDSMSLCAEVLSFTRLARRVSDELGSGAGKRPVIDKGGRLLCMALCLDAVGHKLSVYGQARRRSELQRALLEAYDEMRTAGVGAEQMTAAAERSGDVLAEKLKDMALITESYAALSANIGVDQTDAISALAENIARSTVRTGGFYLDGFTDFTFQEMSVIREMLRSGREVTICLTCDENDRTETFIPSLHTLRVLKTMASELGSDVEVQENRSDSYRLKGSLGKFEKYMSEWNTESFEDKEDSINLYSCGNIIQECELAASRCIKLVRTKKCRWRDIAVAVRGFEEYRSALESAFSRYGVPLFTARRGGINEKPVPVLINSAFEIISGHWGYDDVFSSLKTGLWGIDEDQIDELENYVILWSVSGSRWTAEEDWSLHPRGNGRKFEMADLETLERINAVRRKITVPVTALEEAGKRETTAMGQVQALNAFLEEIGLAETLEQRATRLHENGLTETAAEYVQLWDITVNAMEQFAAILGETKMSQEEFARFFRLLLSCYDVSSIPVSADCVSAGDMDRMRRRNIKHLIVLGASDDRLPQVSTDGKIFSPDEYDALKRAGMDLEGSADGLYREMNLIYNCLTLPSETLCMSYTRQSSEGAERRPAFVIHNASRLFEKKIEPADMRAVKRESRPTAFDLAAAGTDAEAETYFRAAGCAEKLDEMKKAVSSMRGSISRQSVKTLYGSKPTLSASRADAFASCKYSYFLQYGLKVKPREPAGFDPPQYGTFMHYVLENVARRVGEIGGFRQVKPLEIEKLTDEYVEKYVHTELQDFRQRSERFVYLFRRLTATVRRIVCDMAAELADSNFEPLDFELRFSAAGDLPPVNFGDGETEVSFTGVADRVDGWIHDGKLYIRVMDYKTGSKSFSLTDVYRGMGLQMLLYLFAIGKEGKKRYGMDIIPAGVLYVPAKSATVSADGDIDDEELSLKRAKQLRRSGLLLNDPEVLRAMEDNMKPKYIPVKYSAKGIPEGDALAEAEQFGKLSRYIDSLLSGLAGELSRGCIDADPYFRSQSENACIFCQFSDACMFTEGQDHRRYLGKMKTDEVWNGINDRLSGETGEKREI